ncbi:MAG TPA: FecR domain-containing protein [Acidimicrobiales bacterium]|nr:FecR domain-containing protein [Acidimicrobiales bacterium]
MRSYVGPSRRARRQQLIRIAALVGGGLGFLIAVFVIVGGGGGGGSKLATTSLTAKVLSPTVKFRSSSGADPVVLQSSDRLREKAVIETDATGLGEFRYADGSIVRVGPSSNYSLTRARTEGTKRDIAGRLVTGRSWHRVVPRSGKDNDYQVTVLGATGRVEGTSFATVCPVETDCFYTVAKGFVIVKDAAGRDAELHAGDQVEVKFGRLDPVKHLTAEELGSDPWIAQNTTLDGDDALPSTEATVTTLAEETTTTLLGDTTTSVAGQPTTGTTTRGAVTTRPATGTTQPQPNTTQGTTATTQPQATTTTAAPTTTTENPCKRHNGTRPPGCGP